MVTYEYNKSKTVQVEDEQERAYILVNSLIEKRRFIYFRRGPMGTPGYECGREKFKMRKNAVSWSYENRNCNDGSPIFKITGQ